MSTNIFASSRERYLESLRVHLLEAPLMSYLCSVNLPSLSSYEVCSKGGHWFPLGLQLQVLALMRLSLAYFDGPSCWNSTKRLLVNVTLNIDDLKTVALSIERPSSPQASLSVDHDQTLTASRSNLRMTFIHRHRLMSSRPVLDYPDPAEINAVSLPS